ncbi:ATR serine/threonine kinase meiotic 41 [Dermacentor variabilis]|uniref:ATR serine/threonine kinase meiotic 41 n=1 Tax=Dermacentor variabilis TaxID=34621 RepID=UPI003F5B67A9
MEFKHPDSLTALSAIREIQEGSSQVTEPQDEQTSRYREILDNILTSLLNDTEKAFADAEQTRPVLERLLECVQHCAQALPVLFLPQESSEAGSTEQSALRFSESLIGRLLMLMSIPGLGVLSGHCCRVIESLLTLYKRHNMRLLLQFLDNLLEVFVDVYQFCVLNGGTEMATCHFGVTLSFAGHQNVKRSRAEQGSIHISLPDGGCALLLSLMKLLVFLADDMVAFGSGRRLGRDRLVRSLCGLLSADNTELVEASLEALNAFLKQYYPVTENTETEVLLNVTWLIHCVSTDSIALTSLGMDHLVEFLKTVANIQLSPGATEEILLGLSKVMQNLQKHPNLLGASTQLFNKFSADSGCLPLDYVLQKLQENLSPLLEAADTNIVSSKTYVGVLAMEVSKALAKSEGGEENVQHSLIAKTLRDSFVGIKLDRLLYIRDTGLDSLKRVAICLEALQITVLRLLQPSALSNSQNEAKATAAEKATMRVQLNVSSERMVLALLKECLECRLDDERLCNVFHILVLLLRCQEVPSASDLLSFFPAIAVAWNTRFGRVPGLESSDTKLQFEGEGSDDLLCASLTVASFLPRGTFNVEPLLSHALTAGSIEVQRAAARLLCHCILRRNASTAVVHTISSVIERAPEPNLLSWVDCIRDLCCVLSGKAKSFQVGDDWQQPIAVCCFACEAESRSLIATVSDSKYMCDCIIKLCTSSHSSVREAMVSHLPSVLCHLHMDDALIASLLDLLEDADYTVRMKFGNRPLKVLMSRGDPSVRDTIVSRLKQTLNSAWQSENARLQDTLLTAVGCVGQDAKEEDSQAFALLCLLQHLLCRTAGIADIAREQLVELAEHTGSTTSILLKKFRPLVGKFLFDSMIKACHERGFSVNAFLSNLIGIFGSTDVRNFLISMLRFLLPPLVLQAEPVCSRLLKGFAKEIKSVRRDLLMTNFKHIFPYLVCHASGNQLATALSFVEAETGLRIGNVLRFDFQRILNELLFHLGSHYEQVHDGLLVLAREDGFRPIRSTKDLAEFLQPRLLGFLTFFDLQLVNKNIPDDKKKEALRSLECILRLMGQQHVTALRMKLMATLKLALRLSHGEFPSINSCVWNTFIHNLEPASTGPLLSQITATLLPLLKLDPEGATNIFNFLFVDNREQHMSFFHDLHFISEVPELEHVQHTVATPDSQGENNLSNILGHCLHGIAHENLDVRVLALGKLKKVLSANQSKLAEHLLTRESVDPLVSKLIVQLLSGCREADSKVHVLLAECFGELGAIDPGMLELKLLRTEKAVAVHSGVDDKSFAIDLLQRLCRSYLAAEDSRVQDCSSYAIQETLKIYKCSEAKSTLGRNLWKSFSPEVQEIFTPMLSSRYIMSNSGSVEYPHPLFGTSYAQNFRDWLANWTLDLLDKVKGDKALKVFRACSLVFKNDSNLALFLLPRVLVCVLADTDAAGREQVMTEVLAVLQHCEQTDDNSGLLHLCSQTIFSILDYLAVRAKMFRNSSAPGASSASPAAAVLSDEEALFVARIPQDLLARVSFNCQAYTRALFHLESYLHDRPECVQENLQLLQKVYVALDEPDGVAGVAAVRNSQPSLEDQIIEHQAMGKLQDALACYERALRLPTSQASHHQGLLSCLLCLDQPSTALTHASGLLAERSDWLPDIIEYQAEAAWRLCSWDLLQKFLQTQDSIPQDSGNSWSSWGVATGRLLLSAYNLDEKSFLDSLAQARSHQASPLAAAAMEQEAYQRGYRYVSRLHILTEVEQGFRVLLDMEPGSSREEKQAQLTSLLEVWKAREDLVQRSPLLLEPLWNVRRALLSIAKKKHHDLEDVLQTELAKCWLKSAKLARKNGHLQQAYSCLLETDGCDLPDIFLEKAKWLWAKGERERALAQLHRGIERHFPGCATDSGSSDSSSTPEERFACAKARLLLARYSEESAAVESTRLAFLYKSAARACATWEDGLFHFAKYCDTMLPLNEKPEKKADTMVHVVRHYGESLRYGCQHMYHSMPRMLSIWFDLGSQVAEMSRARRVPPGLEKLEGYLKTMTDRALGTLLNQLPPYLFFTALPQLISRICHSHERVSAMLKEIIARLLATYAPQAVWMMIAVSKSSYPMRVQRCQQVFQLARQQNPNLAKFLSDTLSLCEKLLELCNRPVGETNVLQISVHVKGFHEMLKDPGFSRILLPLQSATSVSLPTGGTPRDHKPFPQTPVHLVSINDRVDVLSSLQKPKKISVKGSDGKTYAMMLKPKDDLRKDCRLMEFNNLMNRYLKQSAEGLRRRLHIRTYNVVPLNEECGLIEWIPDLQGFRFILNRIYREKGLLVSSKEIKEMMPELATSVEKKLAIFKEKFLPRFPPVFVEWFHKNFPDPTAWYTARQSYAQTVAVMSIVGFILGLGDRHGENILFDASCGDAVHVDFNCLFNKGETFDWPEKVPFRLTHNMVDAMGPLGYEGVFRKACEVTLRIMRNETDALMSVLKPFVHDPLVEWSKAPKGARSHQSESGEIINEKALVNVNGIEQRLKGVYRGRNKPAGPPLSVEGQVDSLIQEATNEVNLCQMYVGWGAYL